MADGRLAGKVALIMGAGRGFGRVIALRGDVAREDDVEALIAGTLDRFGRLDILVNNAGIMMRGPLLQMPDDQGRRMFDINVMGTLLCSRHALPPMIEQKGPKLAQRAVGGGGFSAYAATKGVIESLTHALAAEVGAHGITVNAIAPGGSRPT